MKKINNKGFMLVETLICATFIVGTLTVIYVQFQNINQSYEVSFKYNTVNNLYLTDQARTYIEQNGVDNLKNALATNDFIDITSCPVEYLQETNYCQELFTTLNIKQIIFTKHDFKTKLDNLSNADSISPDFKDFIKNIKLIDDGDVIYVEFNDNTYAFLKVI